MKGYHSLTLTTSEPSTPLLISIDLNKSDLSFYGYS